MIKKKRIKALEIDFSKITPEMQIEKIKHSPIYKKTLLNRQATDGSEYSRNTTTWE